MAFEAVDGNADALLPSSAGMQAGSEHPLARAVLAAAGMLLARRVFRFRGRPRCAQWPGAVWRLLSTGANCVWEAPAI
ncbi:hypothetical protein APY03_3267 [Variovorax sp. WDL1]|nr:hypothetical protein APY03_3267 [Variovorax sp. WDL1]